jgi:hypothetical protein
MSFISLLERPSKPSFRSKFLFQPLPVEAD